MGGPNCHCILQIRSYAGEVELRQSRCAGTLVVFLEENTYLLSCLVTHFGYLLGPREGRCYPNARCLYLSTFSATPFTESSESESLGEYECCFLEMTMYLHLWALNCKYYSQSRRRFYHCQIVGLDSLLMLLYYQQISLEVC